MCKTSSIYPMEWFEQNGSFAFVNSYVREYGVSKNNFDLLKLFEEARDYNFKNWIEGMINRFPKGMAILDK